MTSIRQAIPGQLFQGEDEELSYSINVGAWNASPTGASVVVKAGSIDVSASVLRAAASAGPSISGSIITTPCLVSLTSACDYRVEVKFRDSDALIWETFFYITGGS